MRLVNIIAFDGGSRHFNGEKNRFNETVATQLKLRRFNNGAATHRVAVAARHYTIIPTYTNNEVAIPSVIDLIDDDTDAVVELGCGWGRNVFTLYNLLSHTKPNLTFIGGELSATGLVAARRAAALEPATAKLGFHPFDHTKPSLAFLEGFKKIVFFTCHSIEQVTMIGTGLVEAMVGAAERVRCVHCEPVGWQLDAEILAHVTAERLAERFPHARLGVFQPVSDYFSASIPAANGWNRDLIRVLHDLATRGLIRIDYVEPSCGGETFYNPSTMIAWTKV